MVEGLAASWLVDQDELVQELERLGKVKESLDLALRRPRGRRWRSFVEARSFARKQGLSTRREWRTFARTDARPRDIPTDPERTYRDCGWKGWEDFLHEPSAGASAAFAEAREVARGLGLQSRADWNRLAKADQLPAGLPHRPDVHYEEQGWAGWADFLGTRASLDEARTFARSLGLRGSAEWYAYCRGDRRGLPPRPERVPANPAAAYRTQGWQGWPDFLGYTPRKAGE
ncbi:MAG: hypothetical protein KIT58_01575 [Planctomycetota bacterium]|nr:hypothetical protein [Planctomycetota bacterium]